MAKMTDIKLNEVSLVDYPAHLVEGFAVMKSANPDKDRALTSVLRKETMPEKTLAELLSEASVDDIRKALDELHETDVEKSTELFPVVAAVVEKSDEPQTEEDILKGASDEVRAAFAKRDEEIAKAREERDAEIEKARVATEQKLDGEAIAKAKTEYTNLGFDFDVVAPAIRKFAGDAPEAAEAITTMLKAVNAQADGAIFKELGTTGSDADTSKSAAEKLTDLAKAATADGTPFHKAYASIVADPANAELVAEHFKEN